MDKKPFTCADYRKEMMLVQLKQRLGRQLLSETEKSDLLREIEKLEIELDVN